MNTEIKRQVALFLRQITIVLIWVDFHVVKDIISFITKKSIISLLKINAFMIVSNILQNL